MKRYFSLVLTIMLLLSTSLMSSYAYSNKNFTPPGLAKKGGLPPGIAKKFKDLESYKWARSSIEKMVSKGVIKGINENEFAPSKNVTKIEALAMIIRTMNWDDKANSYLDLIKKGEAPDKLKDKIQDWGKGYIDVALEKGLIDEVDLWQENFTMPATRQEVAKYIIRALGYETEAEKYMKEDLRFKDASAVQIGNIGYVYFIDEKEIMTGYPDDTFKPNQPVKRVEMAKLVSNIDDKFQDEEANEDAEKEIVEGRITGINFEDKKLIVKMGSTEKLFEAEEDTIVKINDEIEDFKNLYLGMTVKIDVEDEKVIRIYAESMEKEYEGKIIEKIEGSLNKLTIEINEENKTFELDKIVVIESKDDENISFKNLNIESKVKIDVVNNIIVKIEIED